VQFSSNSINNVRNTLKYPTPFWVYESVVYRSSPIDSLLVRERVFKTKLVCT